ncbi:MAG: phosphate ABC transporter substrate-binding protein PstS [Spirochaetaceae bacterium]
MSVLKRFTAATAMVILIAVGGFAGGQGEGGAEGAQDVELEGAGASFVAPLMTAWADEYRDLTDGQVTVNYQSIGSGGGIRQFLEQTIMFGATEAHLNDEQMEQVEEETGGTAFNIPITLGAVAPTFNLPDFGPGGLVFDSETIADIFLGNITRWDDPQIAELNPDADLPDMQIEVVHRSDGSGTTNVWTNYLSKVSSEWEDRVGYGTSVDWPVGTGAKGNEGVAGAVMATEGAIGYNSLIYATANDIPYGDLINKSGNRIQASLETAGAAANTELPEDTRALVTDTTAEDGWPAAGFSWVMAYEKFDENDAISNRTQAEEVVRFLVWVVTDGQDMSEDLDFARLADRPTELGLDMIRRITFEGEPIGEEIVEEMVDM